MSVLAVLGLAACAPSNGGSNEPGTSEATSAAPSSVTGSGAKIDQPKNLSSITNACDLLTPEQLTELGAAGSKAPVPDKSAYGGPGCDWQNDSFGLIVGVDNVTGLGAEAVIESGQTDGKPSNVDGYPAARIGEQSSLCRVDVAVSESQSFTVDFAKYSGKDPAMQDPCGYAEKIASEILKNLPNA